MPSLFRNTGEQEIEQVDTNPTSPTFGTRRWVVSGVNTTACPVPLPASSEFRSAVIAETVYRDNCATPATPDGVTYRLEGGFRTSPVSQFEADRLARQYFDANFQAFANANDNCSAPAEESVSCEYDVTGCFTGFVVVASTGERRQYQGREYDLCYVFQSGSSGSQQFCAPV